jgi:hypothetical protein
MLRRMVTGFAGAHVGRAGEDRVRERLPRSPWQTSLEEPLV